MTTLSTTIRAPLVCLAATTCMALLLTLSSACVKMRTDRGVETRWHEAGPEAFQRGTTTRGEVLQTLGPPSQILSLEGGSAFYYMMETTHANGLILVAYNKRTERTTYDRAVFFFDEQGLLTDYSVSAEAQ